MTTFMNSESWNGQTVVKEKIFNCHFKKKKDKSIRKPQKLLKNEVYVVLIMT